MNDYIKVKVLVKKPKYFIKDLLKKNIELFSVEESEKEVILKIKLQDLETLEKMKTIKKIKVIEFYGKRKILFFLRTHRVYLLILLSGLILNILLSHIIFSVEVITPSKELSSLIKQDLEDLGIKKYQWKVSYQKKNQIKEKIKAKEKDKIEWMEIEEVGTKYKVKVEEKKQKEENTCTYRNIIAKKNGVITKIESSSGEIIKKKEDYVSKGEVIISGMIHNKEEVVSKKCAEGTVYGETWYKVIVEVPTTKKVIKETGKKSLGLYMKFFKKEWIFPKKYEISEKDEYNIIKSKILPVELSILKEKEEEILFQKQDSKMVEKKALKEGEETLKRKLEKDSTILRKNVLKKTTKNSKIIIEVFFAVEEDITSYEDISNIDIEKMNQEME